MPKGVVKTITCVDCGIDVLTKATNRIRCDRCRKENRRVRRKSRGKKENHRWSAEELKWLRDNYAHSTWSNMCAELGLTMGQIRGKATRLGLTRGDQKEEGMLPYAKSAAQLVTERWLEKQ